jgi:hypothetical protein
MGRQNGQLSIAFDCESWVFLATRGHDEAKFTRQWNFVISNTVLKAVAASALTKTHQANQKTQIGMSMDYPKGVLLPTATGERFI